MFLVYLFLSPETKAINFQVRKVPTNKKKIQTKKSITEIAKNVLETSEKGSTNSNNSLKKWKCLSWIYYFYAVQYYGKITFFLLWNLT